MSDRAFVFLRRVREQRPRFLGVVTVKPRPTRGARIQFEFRGKTETGRVASIEPENWDGSAGVTPTIHVVQGKPG
jgi:hypothetical protein